MDVHLDALVALERAFGLLERLRILEAEGDRLERLAAEDGHELLVLSPDLRLERRAAGAEVTDDVPVPTREADFPSDRRIRVSADDLLPETDLGAARDGLLPFGDADVRAHVPRFRADPADDDIADRRAVVAEPNEWNENVDLGADERVAVRADGDVRRRPDEVRRRAIDAARQLRVGAAAEDERILVRACARERGTEAVRQREHADEDGDDEGDADGRERRRRRPLEDAARVVHEGNLHPTCLNAETTGRRAARTAGTSPLASISTSATAEPNASVLGATSKPGRKPPPLK